MIIKSATIFCLIALAHSATIRQADIPVEILYEAKKSTGTELNVSGEDTISNDILKSSDANVVAGIKTVPVEPANSIIEASVSQLDGKSEEKLSAIIEEAVPFKKLPEDVKIEEVPQKISEESITEVKEEQKQTPAQNQPLKPIDDVQKPEEQKIQILPSEPDQALKAVIPEQSTLEEKTTALKEEDNGEKPASQDETTNSVGNIPEQQRPLAMDMEFKFIPGIKAVEYIAKKEEEEVSKMPLEIMSGVGEIVKKKEEVVEKAEENLLPGTKSVKYESLLVQSQNIVAKGLQQLKESLKSSSKPVDWVTLETRINTYFEEEKKKLQTKEEQKPPTNFITNMINQISGIISSGIPAGSNPVSNGEGGTGGTSNPFTSFITFISDNMSGVASSFGWGSGTTSSTILGDSTTSKPVGIFQPIIAGIQSFISGGQQNGQTVSQGEPGSGQQPQQPAIFQPIQEFGNVINTGITNFVKPFLPASSQSPGETNQVAQPAQPAKPEDAIPIAEAVPEKVSLPEKAPLSEKMEIAQPAQPAAATATVEPVKSPESIKLPEVEKPIQEILVEKQSNEKSALPELNEKPALPVSPIALKHEASSTTQHVVSEKQQ